MPHCCFTRDDNTTLSNFQRKEIELCCIYFQLTTYLQVGIHAENVAALIVLADRMQVNSITEACLQSFTELIPTDLALCIKM